MAMFQNQETNQETKKITPLETTANKERSAIVAELKELKPDIKPGAEGEIRAAGALVQRAQFNHEWDTKFYGLVNKGATLFSPELHDALHERVNKAKELGIEGADFAGELHRFKDFGERANKQSAAMLAEREAALKSSKKLTDEAAAGLKSARTPEAAAAAAEKFIQSVEALLPHKKKPAEQKQPAGSDQSLGEISLPRFPSLV